MKLTQKLNASNTQLNRAQDEASTVSVYDFLYHDARRIASYLSQFDDFGHLTGIVKKETTGRSNEKNGEVTAEAGVLSVAKAGGKIGNGTHADYRQASERTYDPLWANALTFLDYLDGNHFLKRDIRSSRIGQIVLFSGELSFFDLGILRKMWELPALKKAAINAAKTEDDQTLSIGNRKDRRRTYWSQNKLNKQNQQSEVEAGIELMTAVPHMVQMSVSTENDAVWACLREDCLVGSPAELMMKHGLIIDGEWHVVGVVDALPDTQDNHLEDGGILDQMIAGSKLAYMAFSAAGQLVPMIRALLGRPQESYGLTPLLVFRKIATDRAE